MEKPFTSPSKRFETPEQELDFLRNKVREIEKDRLENINNKDNPEDSTRDTIREYKKINPKEVLSDKIAMSYEEQERLIAKLEPEEHDLKIAEFKRIVLEKGIKNALLLADKMGNPHIDDDLHRFLIAYIKDGYEPKNISAVLGGVLRMTLYELHIPNIDIEDVQKKITELIFPMEQFLSSMMGMYNRKDKSRPHFALELAVEHIGQEVKVFASVPDAVKSLFEKNIFSSFPGVKLIEVPDDYNIFTEGNAHMCSYAKSDKKVIFPLRTYDKFETDPITSVLNAFSRLRHKGEGASIQILVRPTGEKYTHYFKEALKRIEAGDDIDSAIDIDYTFGKTAVRIFKEMLFKTSKDVISASKDESGKRNNSETAKEAMESIREKISSPILESNIRIVVSSPTEEGSNSLLTALESSFHQFANPRGNTIAFKKLKRRRLNKAFHDFSFRMFDDRYAIPLNLKELATIFHIPAHTSNLSREVKQRKSGYSSAPITVSTSGILLGHNNSSGNEVQIRITPEDRLRHLYLIGQTGTGKTTMMKNMVIQDIQNGDGVCMIDPHGSDIFDVLGSVPKNRIDDVIYFDPSYTSRPLAMNMLEYDANYPEQKTFVVNEMLGIFNKLFDMKTAGGPMFEQYFRNSVLLVMESPETGNTLLDVSRVLSDKSFRDMKLNSSKNPVIVQYWREVAEKAGGEASLQNIVPYITSKFDVFMSNDIMRPIISQEKSSFNFRDLMDNKKILLINLSKGKLGDINANLLGLIIVGKILMAALSRSDSLGHNLPPFYLYIDEFQNITTDSIATILSEARKYKLGLTIANQFIAQLSPEIKDAVFGNVGSVIAYRVGSDDAEYLAKQFSPIFSAKDLMGIDNFRAYARLLMNGQPIKPFDIDAEYPRKGNTDLAQTIIELSHFKYGRDKAEVEAEIAKKYSY